MVFRSPTFLCAQNDDVGAKPGRLLAPLGMTVRVTRDHTLRHSQPTVRSSAKAEIRGRHCYRRCRASGRSERLRTCRSFVSDWKRLRSRHLVEPEYNAPTALRLQETAHSSSGQTQRKRPSASDVLRPPSLHLHDLHVSRVLRRVPEPDCRDARRQGGEVEPLVFGSRRRDREGG